MTILKNGSVIESIESNDVRRGKRGLNRKMKAMISQPMAGLTEEQIITTRNHAIEKLENGGYEVVNTLFTDEWYSKDSMKKRGVVNIPICFLAKSLENMANCDAVFFCNGWEGARGCKIEHEVAEKYGVRILYDEDFME